VTILDLDVNLAYSLSIVLHIVVIMRPNYAASRVRTCLTKQILKLAVLVYTSTPACGHETVVF
jgi:hypothetical protein